MAASVQYKPHNRDLGMVMREVDEDLAIFLGIRNVEMEKNVHFLVQESDQLDEGLKCPEPESVSLLSSNASEAEASLVVADDNFLDLEMERSDHDWLLKRPDYANVQGSTASQTKISNGEETILKPELEKNCETSASVSENSSPLASVECCTAVIRRPSSAEDRKPSRRSSTPTGRQPSLSAKSRPSRSSTPTTKATLLPSSKPVAASRPSAPVVSKSGQRSATPTRKPAAPSNTPSISASDKSSSEKRNGSTVFKGSGPSRGAFPSLKSRPIKPLDMLSLSQDAQQNPKVSMPKRPVSASRGRLTSHSSSSNEKPRRKSCSPAKVRAPISSAPKIGGRMISRSRGCNNVGDDVNPVVMGTKMVDIVVNMRKLAPPKQDDYVYQENHRKSSQENSGFGRSLSKKSLEMAIRHMDIRRSIPDKSRT